MTQAHRIDHARLIQAVATALEAAGMQADDAVLEATIMAEADLLGVPSHGVRMAPGLLAALREGRCKARPDIRTRRETTATSLIDGDNGPGRLLACRAMDDACARARACGIGASLLTRSTHWGRAHAYAARAARAGFVALCATNAIPTMAAWGATRRVIGNNPLAIALPRSERNAPLVLDIAMSQAAVGKVGTWQREGRELPEGWGLDAEGRPSTDGKAVLAGAVLPFGGHKGAGLSLMIELLTAALAGGAFGYELGAQDGSGLDPEASKLFIALDPAAFGGEAVMCARIEELLTHLGAVAAPFTWPGLRGWQEGAGNLAAGGVPLHEEIITQLAAAGIALA